MWEAMSSHGDAPPRQHHHQQQQQQQQQHQQHQQQQHQQHQHQQQQQQFWAPDAGGQQGRGGTPPPHTRAYNAGFGREPPSSDYPPPHLPSSSAIGRRAAGSPDEYEPFWGGEEERVISWSSVESWGGAPRSPGARRHDHVTQDDLRRDLSGGMDGGALGGTKLKTCGIGVNFKRTAAGNYQVQGYLTDKKYPPPKVLQ